MEETKIVDAAAVVGGKRKNGHKMECMCHICENMTKKAKRGGYKVDAEKRMLQKMGGSKKKNGHKMDCGCPICKNMKNAKKGKRGGIGPEPATGVDGEVDFMQKRTGDMVQDEPEEIVKPREVINISWKDFKKIL
jgi:hypothetical protein